MNYSSETANPIKPKKYPKPVVWDLSNFSKELKKEQTVQDLQNIDKISKELEITPTLEVVGYVDHDGNYYNLKQYKLLICKKNLEPVFRLKSGSKEMFVI